MIQLLTFKKRIWGDQQRESKKKTLDLNKSLEIEAYVDNLEKAVKSKNYKEEKWHQKTFPDDLLEIEKQQLKILEESDKRFQAFQNEMLEKQLQNEAIEKQKDR